MEIEYFASAKIIAIKIIILEILKKGSKKMILVLCPIKVNIRYICFNENFVHQKKKIETETRSAQLIMKFSSFLTNL